MTAGRGIVQVAGALALLLVVTACSTDRSEPAADPPTSQLTSRPSGLPVPDPEPLVLVTHATVAQLDLDRTTARRLRSGQVSDWSELGRPAAPLRVVRRVAGVERDPAAVGLVRLDDVGPTVVAARVGGVDPVRDSPKAIGVTVVGDVMLVRGVPDAAAALAPFARRLRSADIAVGNLESTLSLNGSPTQGGDSFGSTPALLGPLRAAGFDALSLANNHAGDYGETALLETVATMRRSTIVPFGAGADLGEASRPAVLEHGGVRFAFVGFNAIGETEQAAPGTPGALSVRMPPRTGPLVPGDLDHVASVVRRAGTRADVVIALPHWGTQYTHTPEPIQREVAQRLVAAGADLVVGGHPHWVQGIDEVRRGGPQGVGVPVLHSLGNFVFDMDFAEETMEGVVLETTWWGEELKAFRLVPYRMQPTDFAPRPVPGDLPGGILEDVRSTSTGPYAP